MATIATPGTRSAESQSPPWRGFRVWSLAEAKSMSGISSNRTTNRMKEMSRFWRRQPNAPKASGNGSTSCLLRNGKRACSTFLRFQVRSPRTARATLIVTNEIIVGLQTEAPLKRAIMPNGGFRMVVNALKAYGYEPDSSVVETFTKYRKTHNEGVFDAYTADVRKMPQLAYPDRTCPTLTAAAASSATTGVSRSTA